MKAYWMAVYKDLKNVKKLKEYAEKATPAIKKYNGKILVRGGRTETVEGTPSPRTVIWEFPNYEKAIECHNSKEYQDGWAIAKETTERNFQIIEGT